ncbi:Electron transfer flavoprotein small subunit [Candidatus Hodgkinia cicadicola]|uniref:Electron transfer flavoprotein small subunit n=1 Tax=Candidatus Hodgkinia cicadicola TaxID=573658 RepID=A0ABX4MG53_9HYPH|nr:Electron transfer flavoprotein small subunit [Candidatus Hodgkinia cicadicola]
MVDNGILNYKDANRVIDPVDEVNVDAILKFKKIVPSAEVSAICLSRDSDKSYLKYVLAMGVNEVIFVRIVNGDKISIDGLLTTKILRRVVLTGKFDLILVGKSSSDSNSGFVGPALATFLGWRQLNYVCGLSCGSVGQLKVRCQVWNRIITFLINLPCVLICEFKKSQRFISLLDLIRAKNRKIKIKVLCKLNLVSNSSISVVNYTIPKQVRTVRNLDNVSSLMTTLFS